MVVAVEMLWVMQWAGRNWAALAITLTCLAVVVFCLLLIAKYTRICLNIFTDTSPPMSMGLCDFQVMQGEVVRFRSFDGTSLRGMWLRTADQAARKGTIVFCHEFGSDMYSCARYARPLIDSGFDVFTFDFRGHGDSSAPAGYRLLQWPSDKELEDALGAIAYVEACLAEANLPMRVGMFGISRGAGTALMAASCNPSVACLVCDGAFSTKETLTTLMKRWAYIFAKIKLVYENQPASFWRFLYWCMMRLAQPRLGRHFPSVRKALENMLPRPIMFIHGERDSYIRSEQTQLLYSCAAEPKYLWIVPQAKHNQSVLAAPQAYARGTVAFFSRYLADEAVDLKDISAPPDAEVA
jgi:pimeloyl-ACP methyl ester carboxylesterase